MCEGRWVDKWDRGPRKIVGGRSDGDINDSAAHPWRYLFDQSTKADSSNKRALGEGPELHLASHRDHLHPFPEELTLVVVVGDDAYDDVADYDDVAGHY